jgi:FtsP/CotA-like multicopper oxidase with cupredoxin domain
VAGAPRIPFAEGEPLVEPEIRASVDGLLETTLRAQYAYRDVGGYRLFVRTYEGTVPGPTLRMKPGDTLRLTLINDLPPNPIQPPPTRTSRTTSTRPISTFTARM